MNKNLKKSMLVLASLLVTSCGNSKYEPLTNVESSLYIKEVSNLKDDFIKGMDVSEVISLENSGVKYYNFNGEEEDVIKILADYGFNYIRVRVWNNPFDSKGNGYGGGNCTIDTALELGKRATKYNMKLLVDFHYSDFWADPSKQMVPIAWSDMDIDTKADALYNYTFESLTKLKDAGVDVGMVQIGNEINNGLAGETSWFNRASLLEKGSKATRSVFPEAKIALHFANPENSDNYKNIASKLKYYEIDYDIFASSYYPYWHGTLDNLKTTLNYISSTYDKDVMVAETSYAFTSEDTDFFGNTIGEGSSVNKSHPYTIQGQSNQIVDVVQTVADMERGIGVFYWAGCWISVGTESYEKNFELWEKYGSGWASSYSAIYDPKDAGKYYGGTAVDNQAFFDATGHPLESLKTWALFKKGNKVDLKADAIEDTNLTIDLNSDIVLPSKVNAIMNDGTKQEVDVVWENVDIDAMKNGGVNKYTIKGKAGGMEATCFVSMVEYNFLNNYSFEDGDTSWDLNDLSGKNEQLYIEDKKTDSLTGTKHVHFWSSAENAIEFSVEQTVKDLKTGKYKFGISIMGGDCKDQEIYLYAKINDEIVTKKSLEITSYGSWDSKVSDEFNYTEGDEIKVGIYVKVSSAGGWGKIDDALLNSCK